jgi:DegV family protein with EDD domain
MLVVTDGAVDLPPHLAYDEGVRVVPGEVWVDDKAFRGDQMAFWDLLRGGTFPSTSPPTVNALAEAYGGGGLVCAIHVSADLSATVARGQAAASRVGSGVIVIDTRSFSVGAGMIVAAVREAADDHGRTTSVIDFARSLPDRLHTFVLVPEADTLRRSGRAGLLPNAHLTRGRPLLLAIRGRAVLLGQPKDRDLGVRELITRARRNSGSGIGPWALGHGDAPDADVIATTLSNALGSPPAFTVSLDPAVGAHVGLGAIVLAVMAGPVDL